MRRRPAATSKRAIVGSGGGGGGFGREVIRSHDWDLCLWVVEGLLGLL